MPGHAVLPGLTITDTLREAAVHGVAVHAPDLAHLLPRLLLDPTAWWAVPDERGDAYKHELVVHTTRERTLKLNVWTLPDLRGGQTSRPHSHPWPFVAHILHGGYTEDRYLPDAGTVLAHRRVEHAAGEANDVGLHVYHEVTEIHEPGATLSLMVCGPGERGRWGYLDTDTGAHRAVERDLAFRARLAALNPHQP